ncbi:MAG TPA: 6,7-dimethyl-8-ribityllumazine synthase [Alphaproteobacteria bacterium]|nr:6,7-dimethyl-8-ribityllumazine synthase [Alphaproteobacteria bacterium]
MAAPKVLIVEARFYPDISDALLAGAKAALSAARAKHEVLTVPGSLEIPSAIAMARREFDGFVALGLVLRKETYHFEVVANESARGLMDLSIRKGLAIGNGILTCDSLEQAMVRANGTHQDKGGDAARACLAMIAVKERFARDNR